MHKYIAASIKLATVTLMNISNGFPMLYVSSFSRYQHIHACIIHMYMLALPRRNNRNFSILKLRNTIVANVNYRSTILWCIMRIKQMKEYHDKDGNSLHHLTFFSRHIPNSVLNIYAVIVFLIKPVWQCTI